MHIRLFPDDFQTIKCILLEGKTWLHSFTVVVLKSKMQTSAFEDFFKWCAFYFSVSYKKNINLIWIKIRLVCS